VGFSAVRTETLAFTGLVALTLACGPKPFTGATDDQGGDDGGALGPDGGGTPDAGTSPDGGSCADSLRLCQHQFTYPFHGESSVSVYGSFTTPVWTSALPMAVSQNEWSVDAELPWNTAVQYKFVIDGGQWVTDPGDPTQLPDGQGGSNSELAAFTCASWSCGS
jgi:hypothetical protein